VRKRWPVQVQAATFLLHYAVFSFRVWASCSRGDCWPQPFNSAWRPYFGFSGWAGLSIFGRSSTPQDSVHRFPANVSREFDLRILDMRNPPRPSNGPPGQVPIQSRLLCCDYASGDFVLLRCQCVPINGGAGPKYGKRGIIYWGSRRTVGEPDERRNEALLVSREALRLGLGTARDLAGLGRSHHMACGIYSHKLLACAAQRYAVPVVRGGHDRGDYRYLLCQGRTSTLALGRLIGRLGRAESRRSIFQDRNRPLLDDHRIAGVERFSHFVFCSIVGGWSAVRDAPGRSHWGIAKPLTQAPVRIQVFAFPKRAISPLFPSGLRQIPSTVAGPCGGLWGRSSRGINPRLRRRLGRKSR